MELTVKVAARGTGVYRAWCPSLPGCEVYGQTRQDVQWRIARAVHGYLASLDIALPRELGKKLLTETTSTYM